MNRTAKSSLTLIFVFILAVVGFGQKRELKGTEWKLVEAYRQRVTNSIAGIAFDDTVTRFTGNTGCNAMSGNADVRGRNIDLTAVRTTKRACKLMEGNVDEGTVMRGIDGARRFDVRGDSLRLYDRRGRELLQFARSGTEAGDDRIRLEGGKWVLEQIKGRQTFVALPHAFVNFDSRKMSVGGDTSCNVFGGNYIVNGSSIRITNVISTMRACVEDSKMSVEREFLDGLRQADTYRFDTGRLKLYRGGQILLTFRRDVR